MKLKGHKLYFKNGQFLNLSVLAENVLLPLTLIGGIALLYWIMFNASKWWALFH